MEKDNAGWRALNVLIMGAYIVGVLFVLLLAYALKPNTYQLKDTIHCSNGYSFKGENYNLQTQYPSNPSLDIGLKADVEIKRFCAYGYNQTTIQANQQVDSYIINTQAQGDTDQAITANLIKNNQLPSNISYSAPPSNYQNGTWDTSTWVVIIGIGGLSLLLWVIKKAVKYIHYGNT